MQLVDNANGGFKFLTGISPYASGAVAADGFEVVHAILAKPLPYKTGFERIEQVLTEHSRPRAALCGVELRLPEPVSFEGFGAFNQGYVELLESWELMVGEYNPIVRTNVAPSVEGVTEPALYAFSFTLPTEATGTTFVVAGAGDIKGQDLSPASIVRYNETSADAMQEKADVVMEFMQERLDGMSISYDDITAVNIYTVQTLQPYLFDSILAKLGSAAIHGVHWHYSRPPIDGLEFEMDIRGVRQELVVQV